MRVLGAIDNAGGKTIQDRIKNTAEITFTDEYGDDRNFTWRAISTWYYRYKKHGITGVTPGSRADKGKTRKVSSQELLEAINQVLPLFREKRYNKSEIYRVCIEKGILTKERIAPPLSTVSFGNMICFQTREKPAKRDWPLLWNMQAIFGRQTPCLART